MSKEENLYSKGKKKKSNVNFQNHCFTKITLPRFTAESCMTLQKSLNFLCLSFLISQMRNLDQLL